MQKYGKTGRVVRAAIGLAAWAGCGAGAFAVERYVDASGSAPAWPYTNWAAAARNIQDALDACADGDEVVVADGVYDKGGTALPGQAVTTRVALTRAVTVRSVNGAAAARIAGRGPAGADAVRCAFVTNGARLIGFTLAGGATLAGAGAWRIDCSGGGAVLAGGALSGCVVASNRAAYGGGVFNAGGLISNCTISGNAALLSPGSGGGVYAVYGGVVRDSRVASNSAIYGAGVFCDREGAIRNCIITNNSAVQNGGAVFCAPSGTVVTCRGVGNRAQKQGGGAYLWQGGSLRGSLLAGNSSAEGSGVCSVRGGVVDGCTVVRNAAGSAGGGIESHDGGRLQSSILLLNTAPAGSNYHASGSGQLFTHCCTAPLAEGEGNTVSDPLFVGAASGQFQLSAGSPCIDAALNEPWMIEVMDLADRPRIWIDAADIGAYEFNPADPLVDTDADGMPDAWEWTWFGHVTNTLASADDDLDRHTAFEECVAGTDPLDPASLLHMVVTARRSEGLTLAWPSAPGRYYTLLRLTNLLNQGDAVVVQDRVPATVPMNTYTETEPVLDAHDTAAYKLKVEK